MEIRKRYFKTSPSQNYVRTTPAGLITKCDIALIPNALQGGSGGYVESNLPTWSTDTSVYGAKGWRKFRPGKAGANVGQFLVELRDIPLIPLRKLIQARSSLERFRSMGGEYLNIQFGWFPFLQDLRDILNTSRDLDRLLKQLRRDNGKRVRRKGSVSTSPKDSTITSLTVSGSSLTPALPTGYYAPGGPVARGAYANRIVSTEEQAWFSAAFRYWIPDIDSPDWESRAMRALYGVNPTPSLLWEVLPWSWLIDWAANVGDVLANMSSNAADNLVADYAFVMLHKKTSTKVEAYDVLLNGGSSPSGYSASAEEVQETKTRVAASPYGFGLVPGDLSGRQQLILGALGISRRF